MSYMNSGYASIQSNAGYRGLENIVSSYSANTNISYMIAETPQRNFTPAYDFPDIRKEVYSDSYRDQKRITQTYYSDDFLNPERTKTVFIGDAQQIKPFVEQAFSKLMNQPFPEDITIRIVSEKEMAKLHPGNVLGFAVNRKHHGLISDIVVKKDMLDRLMITIGHEIGHVLTKRLENEHDEEAKAFAFSLSWMKVIKQENIANLATAIRLDPPAKNGLHNIALDFVLNLVNKGRGAFEIYLDLIRGLLKIGGDDN